MPVSKDLASVGNISWSPSVGWRKYERLWCPLETFGEALASEDKVDRDMMEIKGAPTYVADIWSGIMLVGVDCVYREDRCGGRKGLLA